MYKIQYIFTEKLSYKVKDEPLLISFGYTCGYLTKKIVFFGLITIPLKKYIYKCGDKYNTSLREFKLNMATNTNEKVIYKLN